MQDHFGMERKYIEVEAPINKRYLLYSVIVGLILGLLLMFGMYKYGIFREKKQVENVSQATLNYSKCLELAEANRQTEVLMSCRKRGYITGDCPGNAIDNYLISANFNDFSDNCKRIYSVELGVISE